MEGEWKRKNTFKKRKKEENKINCFEFGSSYEKEELGTKGGGREGFLKWKGKESMQGKRPWIGRTEKEVAGAGGGRHISHPSWKISFFIFNLLGLADISVGPK